MNPNPNSINAAAELPRTLGSTRIAEVTPTTHASDILGIAPKILAVMGSGLSAAARIFDGIAEQRDRQAKQIIAYFGQTSPAHTGKEPEIMLGAWLWH
jgi:hypothetical protein